MNPVVDSATRARSQRAARVSVAFPHSTRSKRANGMPVGASRGAGSAAPTGRFIVVVLMLQPPASGWVGAAAREKKSCSRLPESDGRSSVRRMWLSSASRARASAVTGGPPWSLSTVNVPSGPGRWSMPAVSSACPRASGSGVRRRRPLLASRVAIGPEATTAPREMTTRWSTVACTSWSRWLDRSTVPPRSAKSRSSPRIQAMPSGSRPFAGSSRISTSGRPTSACAIPRRCRIPSSE